MQLFMGGHSGFIAVAGAPQIFQNHDVGLGATLAGGPFRDTFVYWGLGLTQFYRKDPGFNRFKVRARLVFDLAPTWKERAQFWKRSVASWRFFIDTIVDQSLAAGPDGARSTWDSYMTSGPPSGPSSSASAQRPRRSGRMGYLRIGAGVAAVWCSAALVAGTASSQDQGCQDCLTTKVWTVPPDYWDSKRAFDFPEVERLKTLRPRSLGLAFSGGGTRSATATLGQLRAFRHLGWLDDVRYVSAVSGGGWAAVPFTYTKASLADFLGEYRTPNTLERDSVLKQPNGQLAKAIAESSLTASSIREVAGQIAGTQLSEGVNNLLRLVADLRGRSRRDPDRLNKTFARLLGDVLVDPLIEPEGTSASRRLFAWDSPSVAEMLEKNPGRLPANMVVAGRNRPFMIVGGTLISARRDYEYPLLVPLEYTSMYVGARQQFGRFGGIYVWPWAYDTTEVAFAKERLPDGSQVQRTDELLVRYAADRTFSLADVMASTGAAPQLQLLTADTSAKKGELLRRFSDVFPAFTHYVIRTPDDTPSAASTPRLALSEEIPHGDGGFTDNIGLMPLLARQVKNIAAFVNTSEPYPEANRDIRSYFTPIGPPDGGGNKAFSKVFHSTTH